MPTADSPTTPPRTSEAAAESAERTTTLTLRRAPRVSVFLTVGGALGLLAGIVVGALGSGNVSFTAAQVIGYMATIFALLGLALGAFVFLLAERRSVRRAQEVQAWSASHDGSRTGSADASVDPSGDPTRGGARDAAPDRSGGRRADVGD